MGPVSSDFVCHFLSRVVKTSLAFVSGLSLLLCFGAPDKSEVLVFTPNLLGDFQLSGKFVGDGVAEENEDVAMSR